MVIISHRDHIKDSPNIEDRPPTVTVDNNLNIVMKALLEKLRNINRLTSG